MSGGLHHRRPLAAGILGAVAIGSILAAALAFDVLGRDGSSSSEEPTDERSDAALARSEPTATFVVPTPTEAAPEPDAEQPVFANDVVDETAEEKLKRKEEARRRAEERKEERRQNR